MSSEVAPTSLDELAEALRESASDGSVVGVRGAGSKAGWPAVGAPADVTVTTTKLADVVEHAAGDLVLIVQAGCRLADVQEHVAGSRQQLALDPPEAEATVGGVVASAAAGPRRLLFGTPRDLLIGVTVVLADGTVARSGGKVVKNVAGYDLGKLFAGSFGTLGVIAQCTFRLHPAPVARRVISAATADVAAAATTARSTGAVPTAMEYDGENLVVVVEGVEAAAAGQADAVAAAIGGAVGEDLPRGFGQRPWSVVDSDAVVGVKLTHPLGALNAVLSSVESELPSPRVAASVGSGVVFAAWPAGSTDDDAGRIDALRARVDGLDGQLTVPVAPAELKAAVDVWGPARGIDVMRRVKDQFDPDHRMSPGTFVGGI